MVCSVNCKVCLDLYPHWAVEDTTMDHYKELSPEPINVIEGWGLSFSLGAVLKYIARAGKKPGNSRLQDLKKAAWYLNREIELEEKKK